MSKAFTNEEKPDEPPIAPRRAPLPEGVPNYVTKGGLAALQAELRELAQERARLIGSQLDDAERGRALIVVQQRLAQLEERIAGALLVEPDPHSLEQVRFGARVTVEDEEESCRHYTIVGVDEANAAQGRIAFTAPLARALLGKRVGDSVQVRTPRQEQTLTVMAIAYSVD